MSTSARFLSRQLTLRYIVALSIVAVLSVGAWLAMGSVIRMEASRAGKINLSGRQRMLSQRIALQAQGLGAPLAHAERRRLRLELAAAIRVMRASHEVLLRGDEDAEEPGLDSRELRAVYFDRPAEVDRRTRIFLRDSDAVLARSAVAAPG